MSIENSELKIVGVVVAWNRPELLQETLDGLASQTRPLNAVVVIDNASTDYSPEVARNHAVTTEVLTMPRNLGGAGGFAAGIARAVATHDADFVWIMDDDTVPTETALEALLAAREAYPGQPAVLASKAVWTDGREHPMNRPRKRPLLAKEIAQAAEEIDCISIRTASFVSILIDTRAILEEGLPEAAYFLWNDDFEYTSRLLRNRIGLYVPASIVEHKTKKFGDSSADPGPRFFNETRNKVWMYLRSSGLNPAEKLLYGGKTLLRWAQTVRNSSDPAALLNHAKDGIKAGLATVPTTVELLADTPVAADVNALLAPANLFEIGEEKTEFSVLMSVYYGDQPEHFQRALESISKEQTLRPNQIVLVQDGPVTEELQAVIDNAAEITGQTVTHVTLEENRGLAHALDRGLSYCDYELVARADSDDVSLPHRFATQIPLMENLDILGSAIAEFEADETKWGMIRVLPLTQTEINKVARFRDPFNHPTVVFRKNAVIISGGYEECERLEDYWLFARMLQLGARCANLAEPLVAYRVGSGAYNRRGGKELFKAEIELQKRFYDHGFITKPQFVRNLTIRAGYRLIPSELRKKLYRNIAGSHWFNTKTIAND